MNQGELETGDLGGRVVGGEGEGCKDVGKRGGEGTGGDGFIYCNII